MTRETIENAIRSGKIEAEENTKRLAPRKKENDVNSTNIGYLKSFIVNQPRAVTTGSQGSLRQESGTKKNNEKLQFMPIPMSYKELYQSLFDAHVVAAFYLNPLQSPYPKWYDANAQYDYHAGISGHSIENCTAFKKVVERLIKVGVVKFDNAPSVENPIPNDADGGINTISENMGRKVKTDITEVKTPLKWVWKEMAKRRLVISNLKRCDEGIESYCEFHYEEGHGIQECKEFRALIQGLMDNKEIKFYEEVEEEGCIYMSESMSKGPKVNYPMVIISRSKNDVGIQMTPKVIIQKPAVFSYKENKRVHWNYDCNVTILGKESSAKEDQDIEPVKRKAPIAKLKKGKAIESEIPVNEPIKEEEAKEFLKFLKHSEYSVVEQLHKQLAHISILALLLSSEVHRNALMKVLNETYVANDISVNKLDRLINNISADNFIFFNDDEIPPGGMGSTKALHITTRGKGYTLPDVLIDNGSALNVLPLSTLNRLPVDSSHMKGCQNIVRAFDDTERRVMGRIEIPSLIGSTTYEVDFLVMDIKLSYNCLLGRPWIHLAGAVPLSLHQKLKLVSEGRLVTVNAEKDIIAVVSSDAPYLDTDDEAIECSLEFVNVTFIIEGSKILTPKLSKTTRMSLQLMVGRGALPGKGLGRHLQGRIEVSMLKDKCDHFGLGFRADARQRKKELEKRQERRKVQLSGEEIKWEPMVIPYISKTFVLKGIIHPERMTSRKKYIEEMLKDIHINAILEEATEEGTLSDVRPYEPGSVLGNWIVEDILVVFRAYSESPDINNMSDTANDSESLFEQDMCMEDSQDFEVDQGCSLSPDLLRIVE
ncbi:uncharacterized protein LOC108451414 [Gossypium arboreum]|uniref:uncharacterized protein LOC108451414 n=1 Tax=Gossypium arboreum TaxID=29729 RepID=UPI0008190CCF|nr:uncharacterized protein LOC108451414 [Gossypium arboreum]